MSNYKEDFQKVKQKYPTGTLVRVAKDLGPYMSHFPSDCYAFVQYNYASQYGGEDIESYSLLLECPYHGWNSTSWYKECQLTEVFDEDVIKIKLESYKNHKK